MHSGLRLDAAATAAAAATASKSRSAGGRAGHADCASAIATATVITSATGSACITAGKIKRSATSGHAEAQTADTCRDTGADHTA